MLRCTKSGSEHSSSVARFTCIGKLRQQENSSSYAPAIYWPGLKNDVEMDCNTPGAFQRLMEIVLSGLTYKIVLVYIDDTIVFDRSFDEHIHRLKLVFNCLREANLKISAKWSLFQTKLVFLVHAVSADTHWSCQNSSCWKIPCTLSQQFCVPLSQVQNILLQLHDSPASGHLGDKKTLDRIRQLFYWPGLKINFFPESQALQPSRKEKVPSNHISKNFSSGLSMNHFFACQLICLAFFWKVCWMRNFINIS